MYFSVMLGGTYLYEFFMISPKNAEVMAPVGSFESLAAAIKAGTDSVYFGVTQLNMRAKAAHNMTLEDLGKIAHIAQESNVKTYLVVNTLLYDHDTIVMRKIVDSAKENDIDAIIAFDFACMFEDSKIWPEKNLFFGGVNAAGYDAVKKDLWAVSDPRQNGCAVVLD